MRELDEAATGVAGDPGAIALAHSVLEQPVGELPEVAQEDLIRTVDPALLGECRQQLLAGLAVNSLEDAFVDAAILTPGAAAHFLMQILDDDSVDVVQMSAVLRLADRGAKVL